MKKFLLIILVVALYGCSITTVPLKGKYLDAPYVITSDKSLDVVWSNIIDLFATKGLSIKVIDKSSGLIVSERSSLPMTFENNMGKMKDSTAFVVGQIISAGAIDYVPTRAYGEWNVRIKPGESGKTSININLTNIDAVIEAGKQTMHSSGKSTGVFEKLIADQIK